MTKCHNTQVDRLRKPVLERVRTIIVDLVHDDEMNQWAWETCRRHAEAYNRTNAWLGDERWAGRGLPALQGKAGVNGKLTEWRGGDEGFAEVPVSLQRHAAAQALNAHQRWEATQAEHAGAIVEATETAQRAGDKARSEGDGSEPNPAVRIPRRVQRAYVREGPGWHGRKREDWSGRWFAGWCDGMRKLGARSIGVPGGRVLRTTRKVADGNYVSAQLVGTRRRDGIVRWKLHLQVKEAVQRLGGLDSVENSVEGVLLHASVEGAARNVLALDRGFALPVADSDGTTVSREGLDPDALEAKVQRLKSRQGQCRKPRRGRKGSRRWYTLQNEINRTRRKMRAKARHILCIQAKESVKGKSALAWEKLNQGLRRSSKGTEEDPGKGVAQSKGNNRGWSTCRASTIRDIYIRAAIDQGLWLLGVWAAWSSTECHRCGQRDKGNRESQAAFRCLACGHCENADTQAARVLKARGETALTQYLNAVERVQGKDLRHTGGTPTRPRSGSRRRRPTLRVRSTPAQSDGASHPTDGRKGTAPQTSV